jgi:hypothetical protein
MPEKKNEKNKKNTQWLSFGGTKTSGNDPYPRDFPS